MDFVGYYYYQGFRTEMIILYRGGHLFFFGLKAKSVKQKAHGIQSKMPPLKHN